METKTERLWTKLELTEVDQQFVFPVFTVMRKRKETSEGMMCTEAKEEEEPEMRVYQSNKSWFLQSSFLWHTFRKVNIKVWWGFDAEE